MDPEAQVEVKGESLVFKCVTATTQIVNTLFFVVFSVTAVHFFVEKL